MWRVDVSVDAVEILSTQNIVWQKQNVFFAAPTSSFGLLRAETRFGSTALVEASAWIENECKTLHIIRSESKTNIR